MAENLGGVWVMVPTKEFKTSRSMASGMALSCCGVVTSVISPSGSPVVEV